MKVRKQGGHPAKRTFQAIRIEVNQELSVLQNTLEEMIDLLNPGGRLCIITFHSLEDRIVKQAFKKAAGSVYLSTEFSGVRMRQPIKRTYGRKKTDSSVRGGNGT